MRATGTSTTPTNRTRVSPPTSQRGQTSGLPAKLNAKINEKLSKIDGVTDEDKENFKLCLEKLKQKCGGLGVLKQFKEGVEELYKRFPNPPDSFDLQQVLKVMECGGFSIRLNGTLYDENIQSLLFGVGNCLYDFLNVREPSPAMFVYCLAMCNRQTGLPNIFHSGTTGTMEAILNYLNPFSQVSVQFHSSRYPIHQTPSAGVITSQPPSAPSMFASTVTPAPPLPPSEPPAPLKIGMNEAEAEEGEPSAYPQTFTAPFYLTSSAHSGLELLAENLFSTMRLASTDNGFVSIGNKQFRLEQEPETFSSDEVKTKFLHTQQQEMVQLFAEFLNTATKKQLKEFEDNIESASDKDAIEQINFIFSLMSSGLISHVEIKYNFAFFLIEMRYLADKFSVDVELYNDALQNPVSDRYHAFSRNGSDEEKLNASGFKEFIDNFNSRHPQFKLPIKFDSPSGVFRV